MNWLNRENKSGGIPYVINNGKIVYNPNINDLYGDEIQNREDM
jgi:hypothetical protein